MPLFAILTLFPEALEPYARTSILGQARESGRIDLRWVDFRDFARDRHRTVDDRPFGGGPGMVLKPEPIVECVEWLEARHGPFRKLMTCPTGAPFRQPLAEELAREERVLVIAGRYEGYDARIRDLLDVEEVSLGDFVLSGGELAALCIVEAAARLVPGVLGDERSAVEDSFADGGGLDHPQYTRPRVYRGHAVPEPLLSGDHAAIARWRARAAEERTRARRPDLAPDATESGPTESDPTESDRSRPERSSDRPSFEQVEEARHEPD